MLLIILIITLGILIYLGDQIWDEKKAKSIVFSLKVLCILLGTGAMFFGFFYNGPEIFGLGILLILVVPIALFLKKYGKAKKAEPKKAPKQIDHGSADWAEPKELLSTLGRQDVGLHIGFGHLWKKSGHLLSVAGSGKGKGTCLIIPSLLVEPFGSYVVTDPKGENAFITARYQKEAGQRVHILDPWGEQNKQGATHGIPTSGFNPFAFIKNDMEELRDNCEQIATFLIPDKPDAKDPYWNDRARSMVKILLMHIVTALPEEEHNFWTLYKMLRFSDDHWLGLLYDLSKNEAQDGLIAIAAQELIGIEKSGNTMAGIKSTAQNATTIFESPQLRKSLSQDDFNPYSLTDGNCTVYIVIPERYLETHAVWLRLVIGLSLLACNSRPNKRVNFLLDEFAILGKMKDIQKAYAFARGQNIVMWTFVQNLSALKLLYDEDGMNSFIGNSSVFQIFGVKDNFTTEYVSKMLGEATQTKASESFAQSKDSTSVTTSFTSYARRLLTPDEVETEQEIITIVNGLRVKILRIPYFENLMEFDMSEQQQIDFNENAEAEGKIKIWYHIFKKRADPPPRRLD